MKWIFSTFVGLIGAYCVYSMTGTLTNLLLGPLLGYKIMMCSLWGVAITNVDGVKKIQNTNFSFLPEVLLHVNEKETRPKKLILEIFPVVLGFSFCIALSVLYGGVRGLQRYILVGFLSGMAVIYCWHIFIVLKMAVYMRDKQ
ncbi:MAG: hypothetical protein IJZ76_02505 [Lachnospiraceae bacterium]|nr:hypothetical protein [Lachnospiraceae bacterium]